MLNERSFLSHIITAHSRGLFPLFLLDQRSSIRQLNTECLAAFISSGICPPGQNGGTDRIKRSFLPLKNSSGIAHHLSFFHLPYLRRCTIAVRLMRIDGPRALNFLRTVARRSIYTTVFLFYAPTPVCIGCRFQMYFASVTAQGCKAADGPFQ